jgi:hypothetical protein
LLDLWAVSQHWEAVANECIFCCWFTTTLCGRSFWREDSHEVCLEPSCHSLFPHLQSALHSWRDDRADWRLSVGWLAGGVCAGAQVTRRYQVGPFADILRRWLRILHFWSLNFSRMFPGSPGTILQYGILCTDVFLGRTL